MLASGTTATIKRNDGFGHEEQFLLPRPSGRFRFSQRTFAGAHGNDADAPKPAAPWYSVERAGSTHCRHLHQIPASAWTRSLASFRLFEVTGPPGLVQEGLGRAVESQDDKVALTRNRPQPVLFLARERRWTEIKVARTIRVRGPLARHLGEHPGAQRIVVGEEIDPCVEIAEGAAPPEELHIDVSAALVV